MRITQFVMTGEAVAQLLDVLLLVAADGSILDANEAALLCYGYPHSQMLTMNISDVRGRDFETHSIAQTGRAHSLGVMFETDNVRSNGALFPVLVWTAPVIVDGEPATLEVIHDISKRRRDEEKLRLSHAILSTVQESSLDGILVLDQSQRILSYNRRFVEIWNPPSGMLASADGASLLAFCASQLDDSESFTEPVGYAREDPAQSSRNDLILTDGRILDRYSSSMMSPSQEPYGRVWFFQDITSRKRMEQTLLDTLTAVTDVVGTCAEMRDPYTAGHQRRVAELAVAIARDLGMQQADVGDVRTAALLHDVGKMSVPAEILTKPGALSAPEFALIRGHPEAGFGLLTSARVTGSVPEIVHQHHERMDGSGYPRGLMGGELLEGSKVLMVADVLEAMASDRPYRAALGIDAAVAEIEAGAGTLFDSRVVESCVRVVRAPGFVLRQVNS